ncbi:MAG TPA: glycosyltransferase [Verrucomicrobiae bacterium]|jgi:glycosyltransferase involved in cell wall biosynthesis/predicted HAD superfamily hydrolase|nr:glycosyltransferase [Verrucomicrobiae bacterium]
MNEPTVSIPNLPKNLWQRDEPLRRAAELMDRSDSLRAVSFDFFDTIVWRMVNRPTDVFFELGHRLHEQKALAPAINPADFGTLRRYAEMKTRERQNLKDPKVEDISLAAVYDNMRSVLAANPADCAQVEHHAESEICLLNPGMAQFIQHVRERGLKVVIISDIYFSADQLRDILRANHFDPAIFEFILTSCDEKVCKGTGNLFKRALQNLNLSPDQMLHVGDNYHADVIGARHAGIRGVHYPQATVDLRTILDREQILLGGQDTTFSANSLRLLAARYFPEDSVEGFFGRAGVMNMGLLMSRFASWACQQYLNSGVRKIGALMREGDLFAQVLKREIAAKGYDLEVEPLYVNRKATDLAALGKLTAKNLLAWLEARCTLSIRGILQHFGLNAAQLRGLPFALDEKADKQEKILKLAEFLFQPEIARHIEAKSAEERRKVMDYLRPWMDGGALGVCDIGYSASAQMQIHRIFELEKNPTKLVGCYLVTYERAASRVLDGMDIRHFLGAYGKPDYNFRSFIRSPAFIEQALVAPIGTTLGYERHADGSVTPVLDRTPFGPETLLRQKAFKEGVLLFQDLWLNFCAAKPNLLGGKSELSKRVLKDVDAVSQPILLRATSFPTTSELTHFGALPLDDYYFGDSLKQLCGTKDREKLRQTGYGRLLGDAEIHWPQGVHAMENPRSNAEFFSYAKTFIMCNPERDADGADVDLTVFVRGLANPAMLRECLNRVRGVSNPELRLELVVCVPAENKELLAAAKEFARQFKRFRVGEITKRDSINDFMSGAADDSPAPYVLFLQEDTLLPAGWDKSLYEPLRANARAAATFPALKSASAIITDPTVRCLLVRRAAFIEGLGFKKELTPDGAAWNLLLRLQSQNWKSLPCPDVIVESKSLVKNRDLPFTDSHFLKQRWPDYAARMQKLADADAVPANKSSKVIAPAITSAAPQNIKVDWIGSFLDYGSLSHVNRECVNALAADSRMQLKRIANSAIKTADAPAGLRDFAKTLSSSASTDAAITVRHQWPPDWSRPKHGALVVIQPWEFGALPADWVKAAAGVDEFWVPSHYVRNVYITSGIAAEKVFVVPNGVDTAHFNSEVKPLELATKKKFRFLFVGGTISRKGPDVLLKAYLDAFTASDDVCLVIKDFGGQSVYQGQTFEKEIEAARTRPNAPEILYLNTDLAPEDMPRLYAACQCLVHPYRGEGFGMPVLEAMASALPVVVTRGGATDDFVPENAGWLIAAQRKNLGRKLGTIDLAAEGWWLEPDAADLSAKLKHIFAHPGEARTRGQHAAETARKNYSWANIAGKMTARLQTLAARSHPAASASPKQVTRIELPPVALVGHLAAAREALKNKKHREAWTLTTEAINARPFHPEAWLTLAEIAWATGAAAEGKQCLVRACQLAPKWKQVQQAAKHAPRHPVKSGVELSPLPAISATPRLSVCLIVKNEEQFIEKCLASVRDLAHQIVVVDTGSTDRTVELAKKFNAEIHTFAWSDDFSAARNEALKHATGDWVLSLDADEELSPEHRETIKQEMLASEVMGYRLPIIDDGRELEGCSYVPRLFRNAPGLFFLGRVHEQIFSSVEVRAREWSLENRLGKSALLHHGYRPEIVVSRDKIARNLRLLRLAMEELPGEPNLVMNLGLELIRSGEVETGIQQYYEALRLMAALPAPQVVPELRETLLTQLTNHLLKARRFAEIVQLWQQPFPRAAAMTASQHFLLGLAHLELKQPAEVAGQMRECIAKRHQPALSPINQEILKAGPNHCLALSLAALDQHDAAAEAFRAAMGDDAKSRTVRFDFAKFQFRHNASVEALTLLNALVQENPAEIHVWQLGGQIALSQPEFLEFAQNWTSEAIKHFAEQPVIALQHAEALLLNQQAEAALPFWTKAHAPNSARHLAALVICEFASSGTTRQFSAADEKIVSQEFLKWYRQLIKCGANSLASQINEKLDDLHTTLPTAAAILTAAMKQAETAQPA